MESARARAWSSTRWVSARNDNQPPPPPPPPPRPPLPPPFLPPFAPRPLPPPRLPPLAAAIEPPISPGLDCARWSVAQRCSNFHCVRLMRAQVRADDTARGLR